MAHKVYFKCATESEVFKMSPRTGRPKVLSPKTIEIKARIDKETNDRLNQYCEKHSVTRTYVVRKGIETVLGNEKE